MKLVGKTALITGGTSGIGLATAKLFASHGARVVVTGRDESKLDRTRHELGEGALAISADVTSREDMAAAARQVHETFESLDVIFLNAGVVYQTPLAGTDETLYNALMDINVKGVFFAMQALAPILRDGSSVIVNTSFLNQTGSAGLSLLSASKAAVRSLARSWSAELLDRRIRVNAVSPGAIDTPLHDRNRSAEQAQSHRERLAARVPLGRFGTAEDIAQTVLFLAGDDSRYILGAELVVDGGISQL